MRVYGIIVTKFVGGTFLLLGILLGLFFKFHTNGILRQYFQKKPLCKNCNVIMVSLDSLSANHLPCYGYTRNTAPNLCAFAQQNILFTHTYANATWTLPGHVSIFTGLFPSVHGVRNFGDTLGTSIPLLPEILQKQGYKTIFDMPSHDPTLPIPDVYNRGIDAYNPDYPSWTQALADFKRHVSRGNKTFLFLHTYDVHLPYLIGRVPQLYPADPIPGLPLISTEFDGTSSAYIDYLLKSLQKSVDEETENPFVLDKFRSAISIINEFRSNPTILTTKLQPYAPYFVQVFQSFNYFSKIDIHNPRHIEYLKALYDQNIHQMDEGRLSELLTFLRSHDIAKSTVVIITADHGEEFMEHGNISHETPYDSNLRIPLIIYYPGLGKPEKISDPVQSADLVPTLLDMLGIVPTSRFQGESLVPAIRGQKLNSRLLISDTQDLDKKILRNTRWKLFLTLTDEGTYIPSELYDIVNDSGETTNVLFAHPDIAKQMFQEYQTNNVKWNPK